MIFGGEAAEAPIAPAMAMLKGLDAVVIINPSLFQGRGWARPATESGNQPTGQAVYNLKEIRTARAWLTPASPVTDVVAGRKVLG